MTAKMRDLVVAVAAVGAIGFAAFAYTHFTVGRLTAFQRGRVPSVALDDRGQLMGSSAASVKLIEFSDFECSFCRRLHKTLEVLRTNNPHRIAVLYRHYPLKGHPYAFDAAVAAECAANAGRFEAYADLLFQKQDSIGQIGWENLALSAGVQDTVSFRTCRDDDLVKRRVDADIGLGSRLGIEATPVIIVGRRLIVGAISRDSLETLLRPLLRKPRIQVR